MTKNLWLLGCLILEFTPILCGGQFSIENYTDRNEINLRQEVYRWKCSNVTNSYKYNNILLSAEEMLNYFWKSPNPVRYFSSNTLLGSDMKGVQVFVAKYFWKVWHKTKQIISMHYETLSDYFIFNLINVVKMSKFDNHNYVVM